MPNDPILHLLGLARKAGRLELGEEPVGALCRSRHARLVVLASNAAPNTFRRAAHFGEAGNVLWIALPYTKEELGFLFGRGSCAMMAFSDAGFAASLMEKLSARDPERYGPAAEQMRQKADRMLQRQREKRQHEKNVRLGRHRAPAPKAPGKEAAPAGEGRPAGKRSDRKPHSDLPHAPKPPKPGSSARPKGHGGGRTPAASVKPGHGGRKLTGKFRKP